jgi:hypothetical protein
VSYFLTLAVCYFLAALAIDGDTFRVLARDGKSKVTKMYYNAEGSIAESYFLPDGTVYRLSDLDRIV